MIPPRKVWFLFASVGALSATIGAVLVHSGGRPGWEGFLLLLAGAYFWLELGGALRELRP